MGAEWESGLGGRGGRWQEEVDTHAFTRLPVWKIASHPRVKRLMGREAGLQEEEKLKGMSVLCKRVCMINDPHLVTTDSG